MWFWEKEEEKEALSACYSATPAAGSQLALHRPPPSSVALARAARSCLSGLAGAAAGAPVSLTCVHITRRRWPFSPSSPFCSAARPSRRHRISRRRGAFHPNFPRP